MREILISVLAVLVIPAVSTANTLQVGPGKQYATPCAAIAAASPGDTIQIDTSVTYSGDVCEWTTGNLTLVGVGGGRAVLNAAGQNSQGKGIWVVDGDNTTVENIEFTGATVPDNNGAGIRTEANNITIRNCYFHDNQEGILGGNPGSTVIIEFSEFARNGTSDGQAHNVYIGNVTKLIFRYNYSHDSNTGHLLKSRATESDVLYNRLSDNQGTGSYELDLPNGGLAYVIGNMIEQGPNSQNHTILTYQEEGATSGNPSHQLFVVNNTFVNDLNNSASTFINVDSSVSVPAVITNNVFQGPGNLTNQSTAIRTTNFVGNANLVDPANFNYQLQTGSPAIDAGSNPGTGAGMPLTPVYQYVLDSCAQGRVTTGPAIDIGAYEFNGGTGVPPPNAPPTCQPGAAAPAASLSTTSLSFGNQGQGTTSQAKTATLTNTGNAPMTISGISVVGTDSSDFFATNSCGSTLAAGAGCAISVTFTPTAIGNESASISISDNAIGAPQIVALSGTGVATSAPAATLSPTILNFGSQVVGTKSSAQTVNLTNSGTAALSIFSISLTGDFSAADNCGSSLAAGSTCTITTTFKPMGGGSRSGTLSISDNASGSPQTVSLSGTGMSFSLSSSPSSATLNAGQSATFTINVNPIGGFNQAVSLACSGAPTNSTCSASPTVVTLNGLTASTATVTLTTAPRTSFAPPVAFRRGPLSWQLLCLYAIALAAIAVTALARRRRLMAALGAVVLAALTGACAGITGSGSGGGNPTVAGTPSGTSTLTITGQGSGITQTISVILTVK